jgi:hypothetical protein
MRQNIMTVLVEADAITRELWGLLNEEEVTWESVYDEVRAGPPPAGVSMAPDAPPRLILTVQLDSLGRGMQRLAEVMDDRYGTQATLTHAAAAGRVKVVAGQHVAAGPWNIGAEAFNPMWMLGALQSWVLQSYSLTDEQWAALLRQIGHDPLPFSLRAHRDDPEYALFMMLTSLAERMNDCAARRGFVSKPRSAPPNDPDDQPE